MNLTSCTPYTSTPPSLFLLFQSINRKKMADSDPLYLYKLVPSSTPVREPLPERLPVSDIDKKTGFIHLSTAFQVPNTLDSFFKNEPMMYILRIPYEVVAQDIYWECPEGTVCGPRPNEGLFPVCIGFLSPCFYTNSRS